MTRLPQHDRDEATALADKLAFWQGLVSSLAGRASMVGSWFVFPPVTVSLAALELLWLWNQYALRQQANDPPRYDYLNRTGPSRLGTRETLLAEPIPLVGTMMLKFGDELAGHVRALERAWGADQHGDTYARDERLEDAVMLVHQAAASADVITQWFEHHSLIEGWQEILAQPLNSDAERAFDLARNDLAFRAGIGPRRMDALNEFRGSPLIEPALSVSIESDLAAAYGTYAAHFARWSPDEWLQSSS